MQRPAPYAGDEASKTEDSFSEHYDRAAAGARRGAEGLPPRRLEDRRGPGLPGAALLGRRRARRRQNLRRHGDRLPYRRGHLRPAPRDAARRARTRHSHGRARGPTGSLFGSTTLRNFFGLAYVTYVPGDTDEPLSAIAAQVQEQLATGTEPASLKRRMMRMVKLEKNPIVRAVPLFLKDAALDFAAWRATREVTCTVSSLGRVALDAAVAPYVEGISAMTSPAGLNFILCTCGDDLCIGVSSRFVSLRAARHLADVLAAEGLSGRANINKDAAQVMASLRESALEERLASIAATWQSRAIDHPRREQGIGSGDSRKGGRS